MIRHGGVLALFLCFGAISSATAQTLTSITINGAPPSPFKTGAFVELTATGTFTLPAGGTTTGPVYVNWTSSDSTVVSVDNTTGVATALKGSVNPITITATANADIAPATIQIPAVVPQTSLFLAEDNWDVDVYDITFDQTPSLVTTIPFLSTGGLGFNGPGTSVPMAMSPDDRYLFVAQPSYEVEGQSIGDSAFTVVAIDTQSYKVVGSVTAGLCYPTSIAVASHFLYVVNAGPSASQGVGNSYSGACASTNPANVQIYDVNDLPQTSWSPKSVILPSQLEGTTGITGAVPITVAASSDQADGLVYVGSTSNYSPNGTGAGLISPISTSTNTVVAAQILPLTVGPNTNGYSISPLGLTVITSYPASWASGPVHTVFFVGPGYNTTVSPALTGTFFGYFSDACDPSVTCSDYSTVSNIGQIFSDAWPAYYQPIPMAKSPDGKTAYAVNDTYWIDSFVSADGSSSTGFTKGQFFNTAGASTCGSGSGCLPISSLATKANGASLFTSAWASGGGTNELDILNPNSLIEQGSITPPNVVNGVIVSQSPEVKLTLKQSGKQILSASFAVSGNFQNPASIYDPSCIWNGGQPTWDPGLQSSGPSGQNWFPALPDYSSVTSPNLQIIPGISRDANDPPGSIITGISIGPITTTLSANSLNVELGNSNNISAQVINANNDSIVTWQLQSFPACTSQSAQGASCPLGVIVDNGNDSVTYYAPATMPSSSLGSPIITAIPNADTTDQSARASVTITLVTPPAGAYQPTSLTFTTQNVQTTSAPQTVTLTNTGQEPLSLSSNPQVTGTNSADFTVSSTTCTSTILLFPNQSCSISVTFTPTAAGTRTATLEVTDNSGGISGTVQPLTLTGTGQNAGVFAESPTSLTFAAQTVQTTSAAQTVTVTNTGQSNLTLVSASIALPTDFAETPSSTCTSNLAIAPNGSCTINVTFTPTATGSRSGTLTITYNTGGGASNATQSVTLAGTGQSAGAISTSPASLTFAVQTLQTTSAPQTVTVTNTGQASLTVVSSLIALPSDFAVASGTTCTANLALAANGTCVINVTFTPTATGTRNGTLTITYNTGGGSNTTQNVTLAGTGQSPAAISVNPTSLTFAAQATQTTSAAQTVTVTNTGQASLTLVSDLIALPSDFAVASGSTCTANLSLAGNASCVINVTFTPSAGGTRSGTLTITYNNGGGSNATQNVALTGTGQAPAATVTPASLNFTAESIGATSPAQTITVTNSGQGNLLLGSAPAITGTNAGDFALAAGSTCAANQSIAAGGSCTINVTFIPTAAGTRSATVVVTDNSGGIAGTTQSVALSGSAISITVFPANAQLEAGTTQTFVPNILPSSASGPVTWSVSGTGCGGHACGTIDANGVYSVPANLASPATDTIKAVLNSNSAVFGTTQASLFLKPVLSSGQSVTVQAGQAATYNLSIAGGTGDALSPLRLQCLTETLPNGVSCQTVTVQPGAATVGFTFTMQTTGRQTASIRSTEVLLGGFAFVVPFCCLIRLRKQIKHPSLILSVLAVVALSCMGLVGCGTNGSFGSTTPKTFGGTPVGSYTIQLQGTGPSGTPENIGTVGLVVQ